MATAGALRDHLELLVEYGTGDVDVDMAGVTFCDAATLTLLVPPRDISSNAVADIYTS